MLSACVCTVTWPDVPPTVLQGEGTSRSLCNCLLLEPMFGCPGPPAGTQGGQAPGPALTGVPVRADYRVRDSRGNVSLKPVCGGVTPLEVQETDGDAHGGHKQLGSRGDPVLLVQRWQ